MPLAVAAVEYGALASRGSLAQHAGSGAGAVWDSSLATKALILVAVVGLVALRKKAGIVFVLLLATGLVAGSTLLGWP
jgi:hypothetical protein